MTGSPPAQKRRAQQKKSRGGWAGRVQGGDDGEPPRPTSILYDYTTTPLFRKILDFEQVRFPSTTAQHAGLLLPPPMLKTFLGVVPFFHNTTLPKEMVFEHMLLSMRLSTTGCTTSVSSNALSQQAVQRPSSVSFLFPSPSLSPPVAEDSSIEGA